MISFTISATKCDSKQPVSSILTPQSWQEPIKNRWSDWCPRVRTRDWSSNEANNAANQANQAINPNRRGGRWLIPYQRRKSILMLKDSTLVGNYQQVLFPFKLRLLTTLSVLESHLDLCCVSSCTPDVNQIMFNFLCLAPNTIKNTCGWWLER